MRIILYLLVFKILYSCGQGDNSSTKDLLLGNCPDSIDATTNAGERLCKSYSILNVSCMNCHDDWRAYVTNSAWVNSSLVIEGNSFDSQLIYKLTNEGGNMPPNGDTLTESDVEVLKQWIDAL